MYYKAKQELAAFEETTRKTQETSSGFMLLLAQTVPSNLVPVYRRVMELITSSAISGFALKNL